MNKFKIMFGSALLALSFSVSGCNYSETKETAPSTVIEGVSGESGVVNKMRNAENLTQVEKQFLGAWELVSLETILENGDVIQAFGEAPYGRISYTESGHMSAHVVSPERSKIKLGQQILATEGEALDNFKNYIAYFGTYQIDETAKSVTHSVTGALFKNWEGDVQERFYNFEGDQLTLSTGEIVWGDLGTVRTVLTWRKL